MGQKYRTLYTKTQVVFHVVDSDMCRAALLCFHGNIFNIYHIVDKNVCTSTVGMEHIVAFPWRQWLLVHVMTLRYTYLAYLVCYIVVLF